MHRWYNTNLKEHISAPATSHDVFLPNKIR